MHHHQPLLTLLLTALLTSAAGQGIAQSDVTVSLQERAQFWRSLGRADLARQALQKSLRTTPDNPQSLALLAFVSLDLDERQQAMELSRQLQQRHSESPYAAALGQMLEITGDKRTQLGQARLMASTGRREEALRLYQALFAGSPHPSPLALEYWQLLGREPVYREEALQGLQILNRTYPGNLRYKMALARHLARRKPPPLQSIETFIELSQYSQLQREAQSAWRNAVLALDAVPDALPKLRRYLQQDPKDSVVAEQIRTIETAAIAKRKRDDDPVYIGLQRGLTRMEAGDLAAAEPLITTAVRKWPRQADIAGSMGRLRLKQARYQQAASWFQKALAIDDAGKWRSLLQTATYWGLIKRAKSAQGNEQLPQAEKMLREALRLDPQEAYGTSLLAQLRSLRGDTNEAERLYQRALDIDPQNSTALRGLANLYAENDRLDAAFALLDSRKLALGDSWASLQASLLHRRADQQHHGGDADAAIATLHRAINLEPDNPWLRFDLARLLLGKQEEQQAIELFERGLELAPQDPQMRYAYALLLSRLDRDTEALQQLAALPQARLSKSMRQYRNRLQQNHQLQQARTLAEQAQQQQAKKILRQLQQQFKDDPGVLLEIAETWSAIDAPQSARQLLLQLERSTDLSTEQQYRRRQLELAATISHADALTAAGEPHQALELLTETRQRLGAEPKLLRRMARLHSRTGDYDTALSHYKVLAGIALALPGSQGEDAQWLHWSRINADANLRDEVADLLQSRSPKILAGLHLRSRDASDGLSSLESYETPLEMQWPLRGGNLFAHVSPVRLDAGRLDLGKKRTRRLQGTGALCLENCVRTSIPQVEHGTSFAIGYRGEGWRADLGSSPLGFPVSHLLGGIEVEGDLFDIGWRLGLSQRPVTSTLLSYAGMKDAQSGKIWGSVVATGAHLGLSWDQGGSYGIWGTLGAHRLHGERVADNLRLRALGGVYWRLLDKEDYQLRGGFNLMTWRFDKNLEEFTFGHGGYYSPQSYASLSLPVSFYGRKGRWSWELRASVSYSHSRIERSPYYPNDPDLQAKAEQFAPVTGITPFYEGSSGPGTGYKLGGTVEYRVNPYLHLGARMEIERADFYAPNNFALYFRYSARPRLKPMPLYPQPTITYPEFD